MQKKLWLATIIGNILELYDFFLYIFFAPIIAQLFFPPTQTANALTITFLIFSSGFLMRPFGAICFGYLGDRFGRKSTLSIGIILMASSTFLMGCLPTFHTTGSLAYSLLIFCRLLQGFAVGSEFAGSLVYIMEHASPQRRGLYSGLGISSSNLGILLASCVATLTNHLFEHAALYDFAWRLPFLCSIILGGLGLYFRLHMPETPIFIDLINTQRTLKNPLQLTFKQYKLPLIQASLLLFLPAAGSYFFFTYFASYLNSYFGIPLKTALIISSSLLCLNIFVQPFTGMLSDQIGRKTMLLVGTLGVTLLAYPFSLIISEGKLFFICIAAIVLTIFTGTAYGALSALFFELFPAKIRYTAVSFSFNLGNTIFGGFTPTILTFMIAKTGNILIPAYYLIFAGVISSVVLINLRR